MPYKYTKINQAKFLSTVREQQKPMFAMSMFSNQILSLDVKELCSLETIGIRDSVENLKERELNFEFIKWFESSIWLRKQVFPLEIQPGELPIAAVGMESVPELPTKSEVPVDYSDQEVNPELTEVTPVMKVCKFLRCGPLA
ncbi:hypothetical protein TNIN_172221 [Trichonephila inaurata madagascariensis]|uniref:Uncharacterized protein n=1 Tax=Trichonephila inaurata madagascariensis TaxID=2747483 RepID=A0A8X6X1B7_9ARAC|nr:hypothetical protein TNIN_172221 [Trichonephila inaurata madagascariensis]